MRHYRATHTDGTVVEYDADLPQPEHLAAPWRVESISVAEASPAAPPPEPPASVKITKLAFRNRFTAAEKVAIEIAALDNPAAAMQSRALAASLRANQQDVVAAQYIDLRRADTRAGVQALETYGLIGAGRAVEILDAAPVEMERWNGD